MTITKEICREIIARTPHGSPMERIIVAGNVTQEIGAIQKSMKEAVQGDVNGEAWLMRKILGLPHLLPTPLPVSLRKP
jgi:hypothetical protein